MAMPSWLTTVLVSFVRKVVSMLLTGGVVYLTNDPQLMWIAPVVMALGKSVREKFPHTKGWMPI